MYDKALKTLGSIRKAAKSFGLSKSKFVRLWKLELGLCQRKTSCKKKPMPGKTGCKECLSYAVETVDQERLKTYNKEYWVKNKKDLTEKFKVYQKQNLKKFREANKRYLASEKGKVAHKIKTANRRAAKLQRTPKWANQTHIKQIFADCPKGYHVDHILPLQGELISGLHVEHNLQYLTALENDSKGDKFDGTYENESWRLELPPTDR